MAASYNDPVVANKILARIGDQWRNEVWRTSSYFESVKHLGKTLPSRTRKVRWKPLLKKDRIAVITVEEKRVPFGRNS